MSITEGRHQAERPNFIVTPTSARHSFIGPSADPLGRAPTQLHRQQF